MRNLLYPKIPLRLLPAMLGHTVLGVLHGPDYSEWAPLASLLQVSDVRSFVCVAYIHNAGYLGGLTGLVIALLILKFRPEKGDRPQSAGRVLSQTAEGRKACSTTAVQ